MCVVPVRSTRVGHVGVAVTRNDDLCYEIPTIAPGGICRHPEFHGARSRIYTGHLKIWRFGEVFSREDGTIRVHDRRRKCARTVAWRVPGIWSPGNPIQPIGIT